MNFNKLKRLLTFLCYRSQTHLSAAYLISIIHSYISPRYTVRNPEIKCPGRIRKIVRNLFETPSTLNQSGLQIDVSIALEHIALQATELGLGTCWIGSFDTDKVRSILGIPDEVQIIELMTVGYSADKWKQPNREPIEKIVCYEKWEF